MYICYLLKSIFNIECQCLPVTYESEGVSYIKKVIDCQYQFHFLYLLYLININCLIHVPYWLFWIMWPEIIIDGMTCDGVIIDHVIAMTEQYWFHPKTKWLFSSLEFQKACFAMFKWHSWVQSKFYQNRL